MTSPAPDLVITDVRPWGGPAVDVAVTDGRISAIGGTHGDGPRVAGRGRLLLPAFSDVHVHLDSTRLGLPFRPHTGGPGVLTMVENDRRHWREAEVPIRERVSHTVALMVARGTTRMRSYAQIDADCGLERFEAVAAAGQEHRDRCDIEIIAFPQAGLLREDGVVTLMEQALRDGAGVMGGIDPCLLDRDPVRHLDVVFGLAEKYQVPVDVHLHEPGELGVYSVDLILERTRALGMQGQVTISHAYSLGTVAEATQRRLIEEFAELDVSTATVAPSRETGLPLTALTEAGVRVGLGEDGQRDYWSPYGNADMLDRTWQLAFTHNARADRLVEHCLAVATMGGASILDRTVPRLAGVDDRPGLAIGDAADLVLVDGETVTSAVMDRGRDRTVLHAGRVVADALALV